MCYNWTEPSGCFFGVIRADLIFSISLFIFNAKTHRTKEWQQAEDDDQEKIYMR